MLRGARQVGKTWSIRELGKSFAHFLEVNFEQDPSLAGLFAGKLDAPVLAQKLAAYAGVPVEAGRTLLFLDEIQACPDALKSLRFFSEQLPGLHVVAAGSLLEFALAELPSFGVGRIESLYQHPMSFREFLWARKQDALLEAMAQASPSSPLPDALHGRLLELAGDFQLVGGYPAAVQHFVDTGDYLGCFKILDDLLATLIDDFAKYRKRIAPIRLTEVFRSVAAQAGSKFKYSNVGDDWTSAHGKEALDLLVMAGLAHKVVHSDAQGMPLGAQVNAKRFKVILGDIGMHRRLAGTGLVASLSAASHKPADGGTVAEVFVGTELLKYAHPAQRPQLYYWHRESRGSNAEVDYLLETPHGIVPVEVKAGTRGHMQSLRLFCEGHPIHHAIRVSSENFSAYGQVRVVPMYAVEKARETREWSE